MSDDSRHLYDVEWMCVLCSIPIFSSLDEKFDTGIALRSEFRFDQQVEPCVFVQPTSEIRGPPVYL